ncbi:hypothetical protein JCM10213v2_002432 [Rhodosporidiobolus nylandii]
MSSAHKSGASHGRAPSVDGEYRRASTHSLNISYAYGAPASPRTGASTSGRQQSSPEQSRSAISGSSSRRGGEGDIVEEVEVDTGRAAESASVRYGRIQQRKKDTGQAYPPKLSSAAAAAQVGTTANIANAFKLALDNMENGGDRAPDEEDELAPAQQGAKEAPQSGKKRKKHVDRNLSYRPRPGETDSSEESEYDQSRGKQKKRAKHGSDGDDLADDPAAANKPRRRSHKPADPSYNPKRDPSFHAGETSTSESEDGAGKAHRRRKSKGKGRASVGGSSIASQAIPRGVRDGEVWLAAKKRKSKKGGRKSGENGEDDEEDGEDAEGMEQPVEYGYANGAGYEAGSFQGVEEEQEGDITPPAASYYLRPNSPPRQNGARTPSASPQPAQSSWRSPFRFGGGNGAPAVPPVDPAFNAFDRSLGVNGDHSNSLSVSLEDSAIRGSSYDFSEEEAIVRLIEERSAQEQNTRLNPPPAAPPNPSPAQTRQAQQKQRDEEEERRRRGPTPGPSHQRQAALAATPALQHLRQQQPAAPPSPNPSLMATPVPYTGAYPQTPGQSGANGGQESPVNAFRRRAGKGVPVPSMLGAGTTLSPSPDDEDELRRAERKGGEFGRKVGNALRPFVSVGARAWQKTQDPLLDWGRIWKAVFVVAMALFVLLALLAPSTTEPPVHSPSVPPPSRSSFRDYLPFFRSSLPPAPYTPPDVPADSLERLIARLTHLESAVGRISSTSESDREQHAHDRRALSSLSTQLDVLRSTLAGEQEQAKAALDTAQTASAKEAEHLSKAVESVKGDLDSLVSRVKTLSQERDADSSELKKLQSSVDSVGRDIAALNTQVANVAHDLEAATDFGRITQIALEAISKKLPGKMAARIDQSGRLEIDPAFWRVLKDAFADKKAVDTQLTALQSPKGGLFGGSKDSKPAPPGPAAPPSWSDFLAANEDSLKAWVASDLTGRTGSDAFLSKQQFLDLLRREIKTLKRDFENKANENFEQMGQELLNKVAKQEELRKKDSLASHLNPFHRHHQAESSTGSTVTIKSADGQNITAIISSLVDSALLRYSKDVLARPDYALYTAGGRVIRSLTSQTYEPHPISAARSVLAWVTGTAAPRGRPPVTALHPDTAPGSCWPFAGQHGQIGIQLSRRVVPSDITLEHISPDVALDGDVSSAPKDFEVWGVVEGQEDVRKLAQYSQQQFEAKQAAREAGQAPSLEDDLASSGSELASLPPSANHLLLAVGSYDPTASSPVQSFPVTPAARELGLPVNVVVVKVLSNHGESAYTCLYRVRVSGTTDAQAAAASTGDA